MITDLLRVSIHLVPWKWRRRIKDLPLIGPAQRFLVKRILGTRSFLHTVDAGPARGLRISIELPADKQVWTGAYEADFASTLAEAVTPGAVCLDVGGYRGFFSGVFALAGAREVHTFEPLPSNIARIQLMIEVNPELPLVIHRVAIGAAVGETEFVVMPESSMGKLSNSTFQQRERGGKAIRVTVETLDHLIGTGIIPEPDVIKIDVEGAEAMVLAGGERMLRRRQPRLFIEIHSRELARECARILYHFGYSICVLETNSSPDFERDPEVCHFDALGQVLTDGDLISRRPRPLECYSGALEYPHRFTHFDAS